VVELEPAAAHVEVMLVRHERAPLALFGPEVSAALGALLEERVIGLRTATVPTAYAGGELQLVLGAAIPADSIVAAPRLVGPAIDGVPSDRNGFVRCQADGSVFGLAAVYAAGDAVLPSEAGGHRGTAGRYGRRANRGARGRPVGTLSDGTRRASR
jgi:sulfide:quinone oxidoreductase